MPSSQISLVKATVLELPGFNTKFGPNPAQLYSCEYLHLLWRNLCLRTGYCRFLCKAVDVGKSWKRGREKGECTIATYLCIKPPKYYVSKMCLLEVIFARDRMTKWSLCQGIEGGWRCILSSLHTPGSSGQYHRLARGTRTWQLYAGLRRLLCPLPTLISCSVMQRAKPRKAYCK